jgi:predicted TPR repeat methyltransferase
MQVQPEDVDIVVQRLVGRRFDLIVATNVLVYYDLLDQALAFSNVEAMLRPGGFLLSNNALLELPDARLRSEGYLTVQYSDRPDDGDHIVWYRRLPD